ncbi:MAG: hypothetical protein M1358_04980 [Chloroflexi bacterium]|nr:hypothetical protein [Chloroflexota bacterium]
MPNFSSSKIGRLGYISRVSNKVRESRFCVSENTSFLVSVDEATFDTLGMALGANNAESVPIVFGSGGSKVHAQSGTPGTVINVASLPD